MKQTPQHVRIEKYIATQYGVTAEHLWSRYPEFSVFRHPHSKKWFGLIMNISRDKLGLRGTEIVYVLDVHCMPAMLATILSDGDFMAGYHMNKNSWSAIILDDHLTDAEIIPLIDASFNSVTPKRKK